jgi:hypothetical protein
LQKRQSGAYFKVSELRAIFLALLILCLTSPDGAASDPPKMEKQYKLKKEQIKTLAAGHGGCIASDKITVEGLPVLFMYKEQPINGQDSGWRFLSGMESDEYMADSRNHTVFDVNTIANFDPSIIPLLDAPVGSVFEKMPGESAFRVVTDWRP